MTTTELIKLLQQYEKTKKGHPRVIRMYAEDEKGRICKPLLETGTIAVMSADDRLTLAVGDIK